MSVRALDLLFFVPALFLIACGPGQLNGEVTDFALDSELTDTTYTIEVFLPDSWDGSTPLRPVIALDGEQWFEWTAFSAQELVDDGRIAPPLVVSVGYGDGTNERQRDYLPESPDETGGGGVDSFHAFLMGELLPALEERWDVNTDPSARVLVGHSFGGFFSAWAMLEEQSFGGYVSLSPSYYWGHAMIFDQEAELAASIDDLDARVYIAAGAGERWGLPALALAMGDVLEGRNYPSMDVHAELIDGRVHSDVYPSAVTAGLAYTLED
jgi:predicted alpha/beta superfamily hydrolase